MWVRFGRDDRAKPQEYSKYFEDIATKERSKMVRRWDARTGVILSRTLSSDLLAPLAALLCLCWVQAAQAENPNPQAGVAKEAAFPGLSSESLGALSVGHPHEGFLFNGIRMPDGPYWTVALPQYAFGTEETIFALVHCITLVNQQFSESPKVIIGSISKEQGGPFPPHKSHQSGRDVDVGFYYNPGYPVAKPATRENLDVERTWALLRAFITETDVDMILIDKSVQRLLEVHALRKGENPAWLKSVFHDVEGPYSSLIKHVPGHQAHMHVRFSSPLARQRGRGAYTQLVQQGHLPLAQREIAHEVERGDTLRVAPTNALCGYENARPPGSEPHR